MNTAAPAATTGPATNSAPAAANPLAAGIACLIRPGERYAGLMLRADGSLSHHLFLLPGDFKGGWNAAKDWAAAAGGELPSRAEQAVLFGNAKEEFEKDWYWSGEQRAANADCAWYQDFDYGGQVSYDKSASLRARAVRRLSI